MVRSKSCLMSLPTFIVLCIVIAGLSALPWKIGPTSGEMGTTVDIRTSLASYELSAGDTIWYEYEASTLCWFIITTDPFEPETGEKLNLSGIRNSGSFDCQTEGRYILQVKFLEIPSEDTATIEYESYALDDSARVVMIAKPLLLIVTTLVLTFMVAKAGRHAREGHVDGQPWAYDSYWQYFASKTGNWIAVVAGAFMLFAAAIIDLTNPTATVMELAYYLTLFVGRIMVIFGLIFGLIIPWGGYKAMAIQTERTEL